ncbi:hypothetical protein COO60DRAFT_653935 [Scenedesmus sp. NREL 46B-D3]|nr:hypothetical protein COO60DRAFT_653935 [Scenedesmus sp. NREL 46B-D3]
MVFRAQPFELLWAAFVAGTGLAAAGVLAALPAEPERVRRFPLVEGLFPTVVYVPVPEAAAQQLHALAAALVAACAAANLTPCCDLHTDACNSGSKLLLWPTCPASDGKEQTASSTAVARRANELEQQQQQQQQQQHEQTGTEGSAPAQALPLHMSLSQTVPIRYGQAASLKAAVAKQLRPCRRFGAQLSGLACLTNEPKTRSFVCLRVAAGLQQVLRMVGQVDAAFTLHGLPEFHESPLPMCPWPGRQATRLRRCSSGWAASATPQWQCRCPRRCAKWAN